MITFQVENYADAIDEVKVYYPMHYDELASNHEIQLDPDYDAYLRINHLIHLVTVRDGSKLVGYHLSFVMPHLHYRKSLTATTDIYFLDPAYRKGRAGLDLLKFMEKSLKDIGVERIYMMTKTNLNRGKILERLGYSEKEHIYTKMIKD